MLLFRTNDLHVYGYTPRGHRRGRKQAIGITIRVRARGRWRWFQVQVYWPREDLRVGRGTLTVEAVSWLSEGKDRVGVKTFVRFKIGLGCASSAANRGSQLPE